MSSGNRTETYTDSHTLYITSGAATNENVKGSFNTALKEIEKKLNKRLKCKVDINLIFNREGAPYGFGYLYVTNSGVYHMLLGRNMDGTERVKVVDISPKTDFLDFKRLGTEEIQIQEVEKDLDWAEESKYIKLESLSPLMELKPINLTQKQKKILQGLANCSPEICKGEFILGPAIVKEVKPNCVPNLLCSKNIPPWLKEAQVHSRFKLYSTNSQYPKVEIHRHRNRSFVFVEFDPATRDAQFALLMTTKIIFNHPDAKKTDSKILIFSHAFKSGKSEKFSSK